MNTAYSATGTEKCSVQSDGKTFYTTFFKKKHTFLLVAVSKATGADGKALQGFALGVA